jgi:hypothetical protein
MIPLLSTHKKDHITKDMRTSQKMELGRYLNKVDCSILDLHDTCEETNKVFTDVIFTGLNLVMPEKVI